MKKEYFYVKPEDFLNSEDTIYKVDIDDINSLASLALTLEAESDVKESFGYAAHYPNIFIKINIFYQIVIKKLNLRIMEEHFYV